MAAYSCVILLLPVMCSSASSVPVSQQAVYLGSYQVEDSCQFSLCGPDYSPEFMAGKAPMVGSCSGDCNLLAINLNTDKFTKQFLWSNCANMCQQKYPFSRYKEYKPRFLCMESCYTSYQAISPHHNLARYCVKAVCKEKAEESLHQVDCFTACSEHVSRKVSKTDWQDWAMALAGHCMREVGERRENHNYKLSCADKQVWAHITTSMNMSQTDTMATHCFTTICEKDLQCARTCLSHIQVVNKDNRYVWVSCSGSVQCLDRGSKEEQMECAVKCMEHHMERERKLTEKLQIERREKVEQSHKQALLSAGSGAACVRTCVLVVVVAGMGNSVIYYPGY